MPMENQTRRVSELRLDDRNPRLPEELQGKGQVELLDEFHQRYNLEELASSYIKNGFFPAEALIIIEDGTVIEGNRRLAALKYLLHDETAIDAGLPKYDDADNPISSDLLESLQSVPVYVAKSREELTSYLGFHHINGPMQWSASAKARYIAQRVDEVESDGRTDNPFRLVAQEIGSTTPGVRNAYRQYSLLRVARDDLKLQKEANYVLQRRFGVWARLTNAPEIYKYIGFCPQKQTPKGIREALEGLDREKFRSLLRDLQPDDGRPAVLNDSRRASEYASILKNKDALHTLRATHDYALATYIADGSSINKKMKEISRRLASLSDDLIGGAQVDEDTKDLIDKITKQVKGISAMVHDEQDAE